MSEDTKKKAQEERNRVTADKAKEAALKAAQAGQFYLDGDINQARALYKAAAGLLIECVPLQLKASERDFVRLMAAMNLFKGGYYKDALKQVERIKPERLKKDFRSVYYQFEKSLSERLSPKYARNIALKIKKLAAGRQYEKILELLGEHPYALPTDDTIQLRFHYANLAGLITAEEVAKQLGVDVSALSEEAKEAMPETRDPFAPPPGMRRSVVTGDLEPDPEYQAGPQAPEQAIIFDNGSTMKLPEEELPEEERIRGCDDSDVVRKTLFGG
jgi:hypothetical protein